MVNNPLKKLVDEMRQIARANPFNMMEEMPDGKVPCCSNKCKREIFYGKTKFVVFTSDLSTPESFRKMVFYRKAKISVVFTLYLTTPGSSFRKMWHLSINGELSDSLVQTFLVSFFGTKEITYDEMPENKLWEIRTPLVGRRHYAMLAEEGE